MSKKRATAVRRDEIAQAALTIVAENGISRLSIAAVAKKVGIVPSAIYRHFKNKNEVLDAVIALVRSKLAANVAAARAASDDPLDALRLLLMRHLSMIRESQTIPRLIFSEDICAGSRKREALVYAMVSGFLDGVSGIVRQGQKAGSISRRLEPRTVALLFLGLIQPAGMLWRVSRGRFDVAGHARQAWVAFTRAVEPSPKKSANRRQPRERVQ